MTGEERYKIDATRKPRLRGAAISRIKRDNMADCSASGTHVDPHAWRLLSLSGKLSFATRWLPAPLKRVYTHTRVLFRKQKGATREFAGDKALWATPVSSIAVPPWMVSGSDSNFSWNFLARIEMCFLWKFELFFCSIHSNFYSF